jgi:hypothetical protein
MLNIQDFQLQHVITSIGGLGTAAFGLVDATKSAIPQINRIGLPHIQEVVGGLVPEGGNAGVAINALPRADILKTVQANWVNGSDLSAQKAIAKSLIKLHLTAGNAAAVAAHCNVDPQTLTDIAASMANGTPLTQQQSDANARFDLVLTALLDEAYQLSDQDYRNRTRTVAALYAVVLAVLGGWALAGGQPYWLTAQPWMALLVGLLATPLAPIAKDLSSALAAAVNAMQVVKKGV